MESALNISAIARLSMPRARIWSHRYWMMEASSSVRASFSASMNLGLALGIRDLLIPLLEPGHHPPQLPAHLLDLVFRVLPPQRHETKAANLVLQDPLAGEGPRLGVAQDLLHRLLDVVVDHLGAAGVVPVLGRVRDGVAHVGHAALVHQV